MKNFFGKWVGGVFFLMEFWGDGKGKDLGSSPTLFIKYLK